MGEVKTEIVFRYPILTTKKPISAINFGLNLLTVLHKLDHFDVIANFVCNNEMSQLTITMSKFIPDLSWD